MIDRMQSMAEDIRWQQRLSNFSRALDLLDCFLNHLS